MGTFEIVILAIVQGLTEFLPVSSSGHLVVANALLESWGYPPAADLIEVNIVLHLGTLLAVLVHYRREIIRMLRSDWHVAICVIVGTIPAAALGILIKKGLPDQLETGILENVLLAGCLFPVTAALLWFATRRKEGQLDYSQLGLRTALVIGMAQALALLPGISRSGATIAAGLVSGLRRESAATFAFLLAIPAIAGAGVLEGLDAWQAESTSTPLYALALGFAVSFVVGWAALVLLIQFVKQGRLAVFAWYLVPLGMVVIVWQLGVLVSSGG